MKLVIEDDEGCRREVPLDRDEITIGRREDNLVHLPDRNVSRRHARLVQRDGAVLLEDLRSANGTLLNGVRISEPVPLGDGDLIRIGYRAAGRRYGAILSADGRGTVTLHLPPRGQEAVALKNGPTVLLDQAYELDDAPRWERFYLVTGDAPFSLAPVLEAAREAATSAASASPAALRLPPRLDQAVFSLEKGVPR